MANDYATGTYPGDLEEPRRGSLQDFGGATLEDDEDFAPDKNTMLYADLGNGLQRGVAAHEKCVFSVGISVTFSGGGPVVSQVTGGAAAAVIDTITPTDNGDGDTTLSWPAGTFPAHILQPAAFINADTDALAPRAFYVANGVRVKTKAPDGTPTDMAFTVHVF